MAVAEETKMEEAPIEALELSDEDFAKLEGPPELTEKIVEEEPEEEVDPDAVKKAEEDAEAEAKAQEEADAAANKKAEELAAEEASKVFSEEDKDLKKPEPEKKKEEVETDLEADSDKKIKTDKKEDKEVKSDKAGIDYKAEYEKITAPFKANGYDMAVKNTDDAIRLMQMGANYHKKMAGLKPSMRILKLLEKNGLMEENDLNFLIDLHNKNPEAITKLVKDSGMDPLDVNVKDDSKYTPTQHTVNESELDLDAVLEDIHSTPTYQDTLNVITNVWDQDSRNIIANSPQIIKTINEHVADGTYDKVMKAVEYERSMGNLTGISDIRAYKQMGDQLYKAGQFKKEETSPVTETKPEPVIAPTKIDSKAEEKRKERKKAASPTKSKGTPAVVSYNPLSMSDDDFAKIDPNDFKVK